jgi:hypothetical protein
MLDNIKFGLAIPQGWRGGDLPLEKENNPICQYEFSKSIAIAADNLTCLFYYWITVALFQSYQLHFFPRYLTV